jgi:2-polyprenyl-3-methyl-5-hydroxy-6-metoxy-1,4-benzoquinol methylase
MAEKLEKIHQIRNQSKMGSIGAYGKEKGEMFSQWLGQDKKVLELGCRDGSLTELFSAGNDISGADIDASALELFNKKFHTKGYHIDLNSDWPIAEATFDAIVASEVLEHLYRPEEVITKISRTLKDGGMFMGSVPNAFSLANRVRLFLARPSKTALADPSHVHFFSYSELENVLKKYFSEVKLLPLGRLYYLGKLSPALFSYQIVFYCKNPKQ